MHYRILILVLFVSALEINCQIANKHVQRVWESYQHKQQMLTSRLTLNPDAGLNVQDFILKYNYPLESHEVTTEDGYILTLHRIPHSGAGGYHTDNNKSVPVILLVHGFAGSALDFIWQGPKTSLSFQLANLGYDVWLVNARGTVSSRHQNRTRKQSAFWNFSFHEKGYYDLPVTIDYILEHTKIDTLTYIAHSEGTAMGLVLTSTRPDYNKKINLMIFLGPIAYISNMQSAPLLFFSKYGSAIQLLLTVMNIHGISLNPQITDSSTSICDSDNPLQFVCMALVGLICGFDLDQIDRYKFTVWLYTATAFSTKEVFHFHQEIKSGYFRQYDYGSIGNIFHYGVTVPPKYNLAKVSVPLAVYYAKNDYLSTVTDVEQLLSEIPNKPVDAYLNEYENFNHLDYHMAKDIVPLLYSRIFKLLKNRVPVL